MCCNSMRWCTEEVDAPLVSLLGNGNRTGRHGSEQLTPCSPNDDSLIIFDACGRETWLPSSSTRRSATPPRLSVTSMEFPLGKSPSPRIPGPPVRPFTAKLFPPPSLSQRRRNLVQPVTNVFNSYAERQMSGGVASTGFFRHYFSS